MQQVHGIDDQGAVGSILAGGVTELLLRVQSMSLKGFLPPGHLRLCPVAVDPTYRCRSVLGGLGQDVGN
jgi:hypothetical protein